MENILIAIDGTSGVGKGTLASGLAKKYNLQRLDSGAIYRASAIYLVNKKVDLNQLDTNATVLAQACELLQDLPLEFKDDELGVLQVYLDQENVTAELRLETTAANASLIAKNQEIRKALLERQRKYAEQYSRLVVEGRDMGTVVFPEAKLKIFLDASPEAKAQRRYRELVVRGEHAEMSKILEQLNQRDYQDKNRVVAPLVAAADAICIDTTNLDIEQTLELVSEKVDAYLKEIGQL
ncbi:(d)CMP kinase [Psittacicella hinzii]|nr:(d)CMP kinase [Psittacicella hinzii]